MTGLPGITLFHLKKEKNMIETVEVIGDGGAFDTNKINSSFLINGRILYDCGYNVFAELRRRESEAGHFIRRIETVIISHMDDDHMGSVKSLLFYRYFVLGLTTTVICGNDVIEYLKGVNFEMKGSRSVDAKIVELRLTDDIDSILSYRYNMRAKVFYGNHHTPTIGVVLHDDDFIVAISGDTKADEEFEGSIKKVMEHMEAPDERTLIFHDFSYWDAPSRQVHACASDCDIEYSKWFMGKMIKYHNCKCSIAGNKYGANRALHSWTGMSVKRNSGRGTYE